MARVVVPPSRLTVEEPAKSSSPLEPEKVDASPEVLKEFVVEAQLVPTPTTTPTITLSPSGSMTGFSWHVLLVKNKNEFKILAGAAGACLTVLVAGIDNPALNTLAAAAVGLVVKLTLDGLDFWLSDVPVKSS